MRIEQGVDRLRRYVPAGTTTVLAAPDAFACWMASRSVHVVDPAAQEPPPSAVLVTVKVAAEEMELAANKSTV